MFTPKRTKFKKQQKGKLFNKIKTRITNIYTKRNQVVLKAITSGRIYSKQLVATRQTINKVIKKYGKLNVCVFADTPITKKPTEIRMGKGKGAVDSWVCKVKSGSILFKIDASLKILAIKAFKLIQNKLPIRTKII